MSPGRSRSGGNSQRNDVEAEIQILAERATLHLGQQVAVGGGEDAHVHAHRRRAAQPVDLAFLQGAQQLRLQADIHFADLVEQQRPAIRRLEFADTACDGAGERALLVAEQLGLQQVLGDRRTVQRDERRLRTGASGDECGAPAPPCRCPIHP